MRSFTRGTPQQKLQRKAAGQIVVAGEFNSLPVLLSDAQKKKRLAHLYQTNEPLRADQIKARVRGLSDKDLLLHVDDLLTNPNDFLIAQGGAMRDAYNFEKYVMEDEHPMNEVVDRLVEDDNYDPPYQSYAIGAAGSETLHAQLERIRMAAAIYRELADNQAVQTSPQMSFVSLVRPSLDIFVINLALFR